MLHKLYSQSHFSCVQLFAILWTVAHQDPPSMGFSRQGYWSGVPFPSPSPQTLLNFGRKLFALKCMAFSIYFPIIPKDYYMFDFHICLQHSSSVYSIEISFRNLHSCLNGVCVYTTSLSCTYYISFHISNSENKVILNCFSSLFFLPFSMFIRVGHEQHSLCFCFNMMEFTQVIFFLF